MFRFSSSPSLDELRSGSRDVVYGKGWDKYQDPRTLILALVGELGELVSDSKQPKPEPTLDEEVENLNMSSDKPKIKDKRIEELVDVFSYLYGLADECGVDLGSLDTPRSNRSVKFKDFKFTETTWDDLEVTGFYQVALKEADTLLQDVFKLVLSLSNICDSIQWEVADQGLVNLSTKKQVEIDKVLKNVCCHILVIASKHEFDIVHEVHVKTLSISENKKYTDNVLSKDKVFAERYSHLSCYRMVGRGQGFKAGVYLTDGNISEDTAEQCLAKLVEAGALVCEVFQWEGEVQVGLANFKDVNHAHLANELKNIFQAIYNLSHRFSIDLSNAFVIKMAKTAEKYPVNLVKGISSKYTDLQPNNPCASETPNLASSKSLHSFEEVRQMMAEFVSHREWDQFHTPRSLCFNLFGEVGEVLELFVKSPTPDTALLGDELADCLMALTRLADVSNVDLAAVVGASKLC